MSKVLKDKWWKRGVIEGSGAALLDRLFPKRTLYLFDTFEGFDRNDLDTEMARRFSSGVQELEDTSVDAVMNKWNFLDYCVIKEGWFLRSAASVNDRSLFVSIDFNLYDPTIDAPQFLYAKVARGGFLFVHDWNHEKFEGIKISVRELCAEAGVNYAPVADSAGSVMLVK